MKNELVIALRGMGHYTRKPEVMRQLARCKDHAEFQNKLRRMYSLVAVLYS